MLDSTKFLFEALTYDDVLLLPAYSEVLPREVSTQSRLTRNISLNIPIVSAAMDTVTEADLAIALAQEGGIGIIHKNMTIAQQAAQVRKVKRSESGMIIDPVTLKDNSTLGDAQRIMKEFKIGGIPVIDNDGKLVGILTNRDLRFQCISYYFSCAHRMSLNKRMRKMDVCYFNLKRLRLVLLRTPSEQHFQP